MFILPVHYFSSGQFSWCMSIRLQICYGTLTLTADIWTYSLRKYTVFGPELDMFTALILRDSSVLFHGLI